jgi:hypothetical protein
MLIQCKIWSPEKKTVSILGAMHRPSKAASESRQALTQFLRDDISANEDDPNSSPEFKWAHAATPPNTPLRNFAWKWRQSSPIRRGSITRSKIGKEKGGLFEEAVNGKDKVRGPTIFLARNACERE